MKTALPYLLACLLASPALGQSDPKPMTASEFAARVTGKTIFFTQGGEPAGAEAYREDRSVTWTFADGTCAEGAWYPEDDQICFAYLTDPATPLCWHFFQTEGVLTGRLVGADPSEDLTAVGEIDADLPCVPPGQGI